MTTATARRTELAAFLRSRRARITPEELGLPPGPRRRTPGLRREEVALHAGVGVTWYTWLEQGRPINASPQVLDAIGRTLRLDRPELSHLYRLAEVPAAPDPTPCTVLDPAVRAVLDDFATLPACVVNSRLDVLALNLPYAALWPRSVQDGPDKQAGPGNNLLWLSFTVPACCSSLVDRAQELPLLVAAFRAEYGRHLGQPDWERLVAELSAASPEFAAMWETQDVGAHGSRTKTYQHPAVGRLSVLVSHFDIISAPDLRMQVYSPADEVSRERLRWLLDHPDAPYWDHRHES
ncbi:helix-turn-helix transcriptional regulator [Streptacidiphilus sp. PAMC 29251]